MMINNITLQTNLKSSFFPGSLRSLVLTEAVFIGAEKSGYDVTCGLTDKLVAHFPKWVSFLSCSHLEFARSKISCSYWRVSFRLMQEFGWVSRALRRDSRCGRMDWGDLFPQTSDENASQISWVDVRRKRSWSESQSQDPSVVLGYATVFPSFPTSALLVPECFTEFARPITLCHSRKGYPSVIFLWNRLTSEM